MSLHKSLHKMCKTSWWNKEWTVLLCKCLGFRATNIEQRCTSYKLKKQLFYKKVYILWIKKHTKKVYVTVRHTTFIIYSIWVHVERPKYKMIGLKSPKLSEFAILV